MRVRPLLCCIAAAMIAYLGLACLPDAVALPLFCRAPAEVAAAWFNVPLDRETLTYAVSGQTFAMARSCSAEGFLALAFALLLVRRPRWCWAALPLTLVLNTLRAIGTATLTLSLAGFRYERLAHQGLGTLIFAGTLCALWLLTERSSHE